MENKKNNNFDIFNTYTIKQLNYILQVKLFEVNLEEKNKIIQLKEKINEKNDLINLCLNYININEIERLLQVNLQDLKNNNTSHTPNTPTTTNNNDNSQFKMEFEQLSKMTPEQLRYQAACIRRNPNEFRLSQPSLSNMSDLQILQAANQLEMMADNPSTFQAMQNQFANMTPEQLESFKKASNNMMNQTNNNNNNNNNSSNNSSSIKNEMSAFANLTPEQIKYRAECMRKYPEIVRSSNPSMAHLSNEEIKAAADQMEQLASSDPNFMKNMSDYVSTMSEDDLNKIQQNMNQKSSSSNTTSSKSTKSSKSSKSTNNSNSSTTSSTTSSTSTPKPYDMKSIDDFFQLSEEQIIAVVRSFRSNPAMVKKILLTQGMTEQQVDKNIEYLLSMDENQLIYALRTLISLQVYIKPLTRFYLVIDRSTGGYGKIVVSILGFLLVSLIIYFLYKLVSWIFYTIIYYVWNIVDSSSSDISESSKSSSSSSSIPSSSSRRLKPIDINSVDDEFEF